MTTPISIRYAQIDTREALCGLADEWDRLLSKTGADHFFLSWAYVSAWLEHTGAGTKIAVITARNDAGELIGVAPMCITPGLKGLRKYLRTLTFLGGQFDSLAEYGDFIILPGFEEEISAVFSRMLLTSKSLRWDLLHFQFARASSPSMKVFCAQASQSGRAQLTEYPSWICGLGQKWEDFLASRSSRNRQAIRYRERKLAKEHPFEIHHAGKEIPWEEAMKELIRLNRMRWGVDGTAFHTERFVSFHQTLIGRLAPGQVVLTLMKTEGKYIAARYDFVYGKNILNFQIGWDPDWGYYSVSLVLLAITVRSYMEQGFAEYDFMAGDAKYKIDWHTRTEPLMNLEMPNPASLRARAFAGLRKLKALADSFRKPAPAAAPVPEAEPEAAAA